MWRVALGGRRQPAHRRSDRGRVRRGDDRFAPARSDSMMRWTASMGIAMSLSAIGCGYHTVGHTVQLPQNIRTIAIPRFVSRSQTCRVEQVLTEAVVREFNA